MYFTYMQDCWLGASPDGLVHDPTMTDPHGVLEIKCPATAKDTSLEKLWRSSKFFCTRLVTSSTWRRITTIIIRCKDRCTLPREHGVTLWYGHPEPQRWLLRGLHMTLSSGGECTLNSEHIILDPCCLNWLPLGFLHLSMSETQYIMNYIDTYYFNTLYCTPYILLSSIYAIILTRLDIHV